MGRRRPSETRDDGRTPRAAPAALDLELRALRMVEGLFAGEEPSVFLGSGMEPAGVRPYAAGDDVRAVDWRVTARTGRVHVRELVEERGLEVLVVLDRSASLHGGASDRPGRAALDIAAAFAMAADRAGHRLGLLEVGRDGGVCIPPGTERDRGRRVVAALGSGEAGGPVASGGPAGLADALDRARGLTAPGAVVMMVGDFLVERAARRSFEGAAARLHVHRRFLPVRVLVPGPEALPPVGLVTLRDPETGRRVVLDTSSPGTRAHLQEEARLREAWWTGLCRSLDLGSVDVDPARPVEPQLGSIARRRRRAS